MAFRVEKPSFQDREEIKALCSDIWDGQDYIPDMLDKWLSISDPFLIVRDNSNDKICAIDHATIFNNTAYGEGLRVHVDYRGKGLAKLIANAMMKEVFKIGVEGYKALIFSQTLDSIHITEKAFFEPINKYYFLIKPLSRIKEINELPVDVRVRAITPDEISNMKTDFNELLFATEAAIIDVWTFYPSTEYLCDKFLFECDGGILIAGVHEHEKSLFSVCLYTQPGDWLERIIPALESYAGHYGCEEIGVSIPHSKKRWTDSFLKNGFSTLWEDGELTLEESSAYLFSLNRPKMDRLVVPKQMNRKDMPSNYYRCTKRCRYGFSQVIESFPLKNAQPFPTTYYLICPHLKYHISQLEESGMIKELDELKHTAEYKEVDAYYAKHRIERLKYSLIDYDDVFLRYKQAIGLGIGGIKDQSGLKCLHLHTAASLSKLNDPVGRASLKYLEEKGINQYCDNMDCYKYFEEYYLR